MMAVVQVDRDLVPAKRRRGRRQVISEADDSGFAVSTKEHWARILTIKTPDVCLPEVRMKLMKAGLG